MKYIWQLCHATVFPYNQNHDDIHVEPIQTPKVNRALFLPFHEGIKNHKNRASVKICFNR